MVFDANLAPGVNYLEICVPDMTAERFASLLRRAKSHIDSLPITHKFYKEYMYRNLLLQINDKFDAKVYASSCKKLDVAPNGLHVVHYNRDKASFHTFPSRAQAHSVAYVNAMVFKFHNRVFLNFEEKTHEDGSATRRVYVNYNHDDNVDLANIKRRAKQAVDLIVSPYRQPGSAPTCQRVQKIHT